MLFQKPNTTPLTRARNKLAFVDKDWLESIKGLHRLSLMGTKPRRFSFAAAPVDPGIAEVAKLARKALKVEKAALEQFLGAKVRFGPARSTRSELKRRSA